MASKKDWLDEGCRILAEQGAQALTIDLLCSRLSLTKGSFYHHFKGFNGYKSDLLAYFIHEGTMNIINITEQAQNPPAKLQALLDASASYPPHLERAIRAWGLQDRDVQTIQIQVDVQRVAYLRQLFTELGESADRAQLLAQLLYTIFVGCQQIQPPIDENGMATIFYEFQRLYGVRQ